ncbi:MAG: DNA polymerase IV [Alteromonadaceae bacterium]|nr:DNA polymerase IV [Alteromonadaceae bacterium]
MKKIIHIDMDAFYASVEMRDFPQYRDIPIGIGWDTKRSVLCTCNYLARQYGVHSAMPVITAKRLCPNLTIVNGRMEIYREISQQIRRIFLRYTDIIEPLSLDEAYLDVTECKLFKGSATLIAEQIRADIFRELNLTASAGVAPNKFLAKIASDENKPNGQCVITPDKVAEFVSELPLRKISGIGPKTAEKLAKHGFTTCADVRASSENNLKTIVGKFATSLYQRGFGVDNRELTVKRQRKSLAVETTLAQDISSEQQCLEIIAVLKTKLLQRLANVEGRKICRQGIKLKFFDFNQTTVEQQSNCFNEQLIPELLSTALSRSKGRAIRLIGLTLGFTALEKKSEINKNNNLLENQQQEKYVEQLCLNIE